MAFRTQKISQMTPKGSDLEATDLIEVSTIESGSYVTRSITGQELIDAIPAPSVDWGDIGGTLSDQTDLNTALSGKVPTSRTLTINGTTQDLSADRTFTISTGITIGTTLITSGTVGRVMFQGTGNVVQQSANLFWDNTNGRLGIGTNAPSNNLQVLGASGTIATVKINTANRATGMSFRYSDVGDSGSLTYNNIFYFTRNDNTFPLYLSANSNVLINTITDAGFRLDVNGTARVQGALTLSAASPSITLGGDLTITSTLYPSRVASYDILNSNLNLLAGGFGEGMFIGSRLTGSRTSTTFVSPDGLNAVGSAKITAYDGNGNTNIQASNNGNRSIVLRGLGASGAVLIGNITTGNGTNYSAILQADSTTQGFLPPRMTTTQKNAIASPATGLMVYDTTLNLISVYNGTTWITL